MIVSKNAWSWTRVGHVFLFFSCLLACSAVVSGAQAADTPEQEMGRIAAIVGARQATVGEADWKLIEYDKEALTFIGASFKPDRDGEGIGTKFFVFMPRKEATSRALLEFKKGESLQGRLQVTIEASKHEVKVTTVEVKKDK